MPRARLPIETAVSVNRLTALRPRIAAVVLAGVIALAMVMIQVSAGTVDDAYERAAHGELTAIATTWEDGFEPADLADPELMQRRVTRLQALNPGLHKIGVSWHDADGITRLAQAGHEHDPDGVKRDITTSRPIVVERGDAAPIDLPPQPYHEVHAADGAHYAEIHYAVGDGPSAMLELHYDLKGLDEARAADGTTLSALGLGAALLLGLIVSLLLGRTVVDPLDRVRAVANRIREGDSGARVQMDRRDEIGVLARDFDRMADAMLEALNDPLTGLLNHRAFQEQLSVELRRAERARYPVAVVALDLDDFKIVNDALGHAAGDRALRAVAAAIREELRTGDVCGRVGGDEFMLAIADADLGGAEAVVERVRARVRDVRLGTGQRLTLSAGIAAYPRHGTAQEQLLNLADGAMYWAKSHGKDRTFVYSTSIDFALSAEEAAERNLRAGLVNTVHALARAVDAKDGYTHSHSQRVARYAAELGRELGLDAERLERVRTAGVLHDVGKIGIPDAVLLKPEGLDGAEIGLMRRHSELGHDIVAGAGLHEIADWVLHLHERFDGGGYPRGLAGDEIPLESRILHCADALEAMTASRVYRPAMPVDEALAELEAASGSQFDPAVVAALVTLVRERRLPIGDTAPATLS
jgi:diguanylate cyclase (GGDEF)-like protein